VCFFVAWGFGCSGGVGWLVVVGIVFWGWVGRMVGDVVVFGLCGGLFRGGFFACVGFGVWLCVCVRFVGVFL